MKKELKRKIHLVLSISAYLSMHLAHADPITINNNYPNQAPNTSVQAPQAACNASAPGQSYGTNTPPGTYKIKHGDGSSDTVYTTGDKKPYIVDNSGCNSSSPIMQPYVYVQPPGGAPGPVPTPGPVPGPRR